MFVRAAPPIWYFPNLVGTQLDDTYYLFVLQNVFPYLPSPVYHDNQGLTPWTEPVQFLSNGTLPDNLYFNPNLVYRLQVRQGNTMDAALIYDILNFVPGSGITPPVVTSGASENEATNPQFSLINFTSPLTITQSGTHSIAPGWDLVLTGTGSTTITQIAFSGNENIVGNPPFALQFNNAGWTTATLQQTFTENGALYANGAISISLTALSENVNEPIVVNYVPSDGAPTVIISDTIPTSGYVEINGAAAIPASTNTDVSPGAFINIEIDLPPTGIISLTNIQIIGQELPLAVNYNEESIERQIDHTFNVYRNELIIKPKNSILTGWNFALNPFQFNPTALSAQATQCTYIADQTILYQETANNISTGQASNSNGKGLLIQPNGSATNTRFALISYIDPTTIAPYWNFYLSSLVRAGINMASASRVPLKMRLIYRTSLPPTISAVEPIVSWTLGQDPVFAAGWTAISPLNDPAYILPNTFSSFESGNVFPGLSFDQFPMPPASSANMTLGIVLYTMTRMATGDSIILDKASLVPNRFAVDTDPETFDESLRKCQFYYEKSYPYTVFPGSVTRAGAVVQQKPLFYDPANSNNAKINAQSFGFGYKQTKRASPLITIYDPTTGASANSNISIWNQGVSIFGMSIVMSSYTLLSNSTEAAYYVCNDTDTAQGGGNNTIGNEGILTFQYSLDSRMGI